MPARQTDSRADLVAQWPSYLVPMAMDPRDAQHREDAVEAAVERFGGIDVLVDNAGSGLFGAGEEVTDEELHLLRPRHHPFGSHDIGRLAGMLDLNRNL